MPIPTILVVAGIVFLLLSIAGELADSIAVPPEQKRWAAIMGSFLLAVSIVLDVIPVVHNYCIAASLADQPVSRHRRHPPKSWTSKLP